MENKRTIEITNPTIEALVKKKQELVKLGTQFNEDALQLAKEHEKLVGKIEEKAQEIRKVQLEIIPLVKKQCEKDNLLNEYEVPITTAIRNGKLVLEVEDKMKAFVDTFKGIDKYNEVPELKKKKTKPKK